jgi:predicted ester cyclase
MSEANKRLVRHHFEEIFNKKHFAVCAEIMAEEFVEHAAAPFAQGAPGRVNGPQAMRQTAEWLVAQFPDLRMTVEAMVSEGDIVAAFSKADGGRVWRMDTSGSTQVVEIMDGKLAVGRHFVEVADEPGDGCGFRSSDPKTLDPGDECERRDGLAAYSLDGRLDPWDPPLTGKYDLAWALHPEGASKGTRLHVGGSFTRVGGVTQSYYARLS